MATTSLLAVRPIFNAFLVVFIGLICYFFIQLYRARMLFINRKRLGLVRTYPPSSLNKPLINFLRLYSLVHPTTISSSGIFST